MFYLFQFSFHCKNLGARKYLEADACNQMFLSVLCLWVVNFHGFLNWNGYAEGASISLCPYKLLVVQLKVRTLSLESVVWPLKYRLALSTKNKTSWTSLSTYFVGQVRLWGYEMARASNCSKLTIYLKHIWIAIAYVVFQLLNCSLNFFHLILQLQAAKRRGCTNYSKRHVACFRVFERA